jgi:tetratricopeptide (TPR) repeat protein
MQPIRTALVFLLPWLLLAGLLTGCGASDSEDSDIPITTSSSEARTFFLQGREALDLGRADDANALFDQAIATDTTFALACGYRARYAGTRAEWRYYTDQAARHAAQVSAGEKLLLALFTAEIEGDLAQAKSLARSLHERYPRSPRTLYAYAVVQTANDQTYEARALLEEAIELNGLFAPALRELANSYLFEDPRDLREAESYAARYVDRYPEEADAHITLGDVHRAAMRLEEARGEYTRALMLKKDSYTAYIKRGHALTFIGLYDEARKDFVRATELGIGLAKARAANYRTFTWLYAGQLTDALRENTAVLSSLPLLGFDEQIDFQPYMDTWHYRFLMSVEARAFDDATAALAQYARFARAIAAQVGTTNYTQTTESEIAILEGRLALRRGEYIVARGHADRSFDFLRKVRSARKHENTELLIGQIALAQKSYGSALEHLHQANQDLIQVKFHRAIALEQLGRESEAQELYRQVADLDFNDIEYALIREKAIAALR